MLVGRYAGRRLVDWLTWYLTGSVGTYRHYKSDSPRPTYIARALRTSLPSNPYFDLWRLIMAVKRWDAMKARRGDGSQWWSRKEEDGLGRGQERGKQEHPPQWRDLASAINWHICGCLRAHALGRPTRPSAQDSCRITNRRPPHCRRAIALDGRRKVTSARIWLISAKLWRIPSILGIHGVGFWRQVKPDIRGAKSGARECLLGTEEAEAEPTLVTLRLVVPTSRYPDASAFLYSDVDNVLQKVGNGATAL